MVNTQELLLIFFLFSIVLLVGVVVYLFVQVSRLRSQTNNAKETVLKDEKNKTQNSIQNHEEMCVHHQDREASGVCNICEQSFCKECIKEHDGLSFCSTHLKYFLSHEWLSLQTIKTTPEDPHEALHLYDFKRRLWAQKGTPLVVRTHYKINIEADYIESYVELLCSKNDESEVASKFPLKGDGYA